MSALLTYRSKLLRSRRFGQSNKPLSASGNLTPRASPKPPKAESADEALAASTHQLLKNILSFLPNPTLDIMARTHHDSIPTASHGVISIIPLVHWIHTIKFYHGMYTTKYHIRNIVDLRIQFAESCSSDGLGLCSASLAGGHLQEA